MSFRSLNSTVSLAVLALAAGVAVAAPRAVTPIVPDSQLPGNSVKLDLAKWPQLKLETRRDPKAEARIDALLRKMTVEEKVGQILQPEITSITPDEVRQYHIGSVLNGGNGRPNKDLKASAADWLKLADAYWAASTDKRGGAVGVPIIWGIDSVHGNNSVYGGTIFPHNVGLGAANNPRLMVDIGRVTAVESAAIGTDWTFAPAVSVPQDDRWGRTYEGYSEEPALAGKLAASYVHGLQGDPRGKFFPGGSIIATVKHFVADGGTQNGRDQGDAVVSEDVLRNVHFKPYVAPLEAGAQTVMASYSKWNGMRMHGHGPLLTRMLKERGGFDGFVVGDFNGHALIPGCTNGNCPQALMAGVDMYMIPADWKELHGNLVKQVKDGTVPMARLDDAVRRVLRVKERAGLFKAPKPSARAFAGQANIGTPEHRLVARQAARESMVLLKDDRKILPFPANSKVLVAGQGADSVPMLVGGWSMNWQGTGLTNANFPGATSVFAGLSNTLKENGGSAVLSRDGSFTDKPDYAVVVFGETPYAEYQGDRESVIYKAPETDADLALIKRLHAAGIPTVGLFLSGRPLWINPHLNAADAMIAAWLPGTEGGSAAADLLVAGKDGKPRHDFTGKLSFSWPKLASQSALNVGDAGYDPLFPFGYGLTLGTRTAFQPLSEDPGISAEKLAAASNAAFFIDGRALAPWRVYLGDTQEARLKTEGDRFVTSRSGAVKFESADRNRQEDTKIATWSGSGRGSVFVLGYSVVDFAAKLAADDAIVMSAAVLQAPKGKVTASFGTVAQNSSVDLTPVLSQLTPGQWEEISIPLRCFVGGKADFAKVDMPLNLTTDGAFQIQLAKLGVGPARGRKLGC